MFVLNSAEQKFADNPQNINRCNHNRSTSYDGKHSVERICMLERTDKYSHFGNEAAQSRETQRSQTGNHVTNRKERHDLHQTSHLPNITGMRTSINHTDEGKEKSGHQTVRKHLHHGSGHSRRVQHQYGEQNQTAVTHRRVSVDVFEVGLNTSAERSVNYTDTGKY